MPLKEYECQGCRKRFEVILSLNEPDPSSCPHCGGKELKRILGTFKIGGSSRKSARDEGGTAGEGAPPIPGMGGFEDGMDGGFDDEGMDGIGMDGDSPAETGDDEEEDGK